MEKRKRKKKRKGKKKGKQKRKRGVTFLFYTFSFLEGLIQKEREKTEKTDSDTFHSAKGSIGFI